MEHVAWFGWYMFIFLAFFWFLLSGYIYMGTVRYQWIADHGITEICCWDIIWASSRLIFYCHIL
jgi:hypothetical protein